MSRSVVIKQNDKRARLSQLRQSTLHKMDTIEQVKVPEGEEPTQWLAVNAGEFTREVSLVYDVCLEDAKRFTIKGAGYPPGVEYRWVDPLEELKPEPIRCSSPKYVDYCLEWIEQTLNNPAIFPLDEDQPFPDEFRMVIEYIFTRLYRIMSIVYSRHFETAIEPVKFSRHCNTVMKHLMYFIFEFELVPTHEFKHLKKIVQRYQKQYLEDRAKRDK